MDEPSDDVLKWYLVMVEGGGRVAGLSWQCQRLSGTIPAEIGALSALRCLRLHSNKLSGSIPPTIGALTSLDSLLLSSNPLSGVVTSTLSNLTNLECLWLFGIALINCPDNKYLAKSEVQDYLSTPWRPQALRFLTYGIASTKKRQAILGRCISPCRATSPPHPFFAFLATSERGLTDLGTGTISRGGKGSMILRAGG